MINRLLSLSNNKFDLSSDEICVCREHKENSMYFFYFPALRVVDYRLAEQIIRTP